MKLRRFNRVLQQVSFLPVLTLAVTSGVLYLQILGANRTVGLIERSDHRISQSRLAAKLIVDEETGLRGFQATRDRRFLAPYTEAEGQLEQVFQTLESVPGMPGPDGVPAHGISELKADHAAWKEGFARPIVEGTRSSVAINDPEWNMRGKLMMDRVRSDLAGVVERAEQRRTNRIQRWEQQVRWTEFALFGLAIGAGGLIGWFTRSRMHQVSDAYGATLEDLTRRSDEIFASEERLRTTITSIGDGVITCDPEGRVQMMNTAAEQLTGWTQEQAREMLLERVFRIVNETTRGVAENPVAKVQRLNRVVGLANHTTLIRRDETELHIADSGAPIRDKQGNIIGFVLVFRDVTLERRTQEALVAQEKLAVAGRLAATIAHEINNPLSSVLDMLYLMRRGVNDEDGRLYMQMAEAELTRVGEIVRAMLGLYRESQVPIMVELGSTMRDVLLLLDRHVTDLGVRVVADLPRDICIMGFPAELRQVFTNLVTNAAEAAGRGGEMRVSVAWASDRVGERMLQGAAVTIEDSGPGIEEHVLAQLFQPFFTTKGERGTGLGLWVSKGIISKHNGTIELRSRTHTKELGTGVRGTVARVFLPAGAASISPAGATSA